ncbi:hypothetical protein ABW19_dt0205121 [Dactylella cylindrospora]|nr:hypothetical protein ABW19_dt0205121 [Dactylella cylindrospora]
MQPEFPEGTLRTLFIKEAFQGHTKKMFQFIWKNILTDLKNRDELEVGSNAISTAKGITAELENGDGLGFPSLANNVNEVLKSTKKQSSNVANPFMEAVEPKLPFASQHQIKVEVSSVSDPQQINQGEIDQRNAGRSTDPSFTDQIILENINKGPNTSALHERLGLSGTIHEILNPNSNNLVQEQRDSQIRVKKETLQPARFGKQRREPIKVKEESVEQIKVMKETLESKPQPSTGGPKLEYTPSDPLGPRPGLRTYISDLIPNFTPKKLKSMEHKASKRHETPKRLRIFKYPIIR